MQYIHDHYYKNLGPNNYMVKDEPKTFAFELPDYDLVETEVVKSITNEGYVGQVSLKVGIAKLHENDNYVKATGRKVAEKNMEMVDFSIKQINVWPADNEVTLRLYNVDKDLYIRMVMRKSYRNIRILASFFEYEK